MLLVEDFLPVDHFLEISMHGFLFVADRIFLLNFRSMFLPVILGVSSGVLDVIIFHSFSTYTYLVVYFLLIDKAHCGISKYVHK